MEYKNIRFDNLQIDIIDGDRGKNYPKKSEMNNKGYTLFLNNKNLINNYLDDSCGEYISKEKDEILRSGKLKRGGTKSRNRRS